MMDLYGDVRADAMRDTADQLVTGKTKSVMVQ